MKRCYWYIGKIRGRPAFNGRSRTFTNDSQLAKCAGSKQSHPIRSKRIYPRCCRMVLAYSCFLMFIYLQIRYTAYTSQKMSLYLRDQLLTRLRYSDYQTFHKVTVGNYASKLSNDITMIETDGFANIYQGHARCIVFTFCRYRISPISLVIDRAHLRSVLFFCFCCRKSFKKMKQSAVALPLRQMKLFGKTNELLAGFDTFLNFQRLDFLKINSWVPHKESSPQS